MGGKRKLTTHFQEVLDLDNVTHFYDLMAGSLPVSLWAYEALPNAEIHINELNPHIIALYKCVRDYPQELSSYLVELGKDYLDLPYEQELCVKGSRNQRARYRYYYDLRQKQYDEYHTNGETVKYCAMMLWLQCHSFGGAWQSTVAMSPVFATPSGYLEEKRDKIDYSNLKDVSKMLQNSRVYLTAGDYKDVAIAEKGAFIYLDPPYIETNHKYNHCKFGLDAQKELMAYMEAHADSKVAMSNAPHEYWDGFSDNFTTLSKDYLYRAYSGSKGDKQEGDVRSKGTKLVKEELVSNSFKK